MVKNLPANAGDSGSIPGWGRSPWEGNDNPLQYSGKSPGQRSLVGCTPVFWKILLAWKISWSEKPGGLQSVGLQRVGQDRVTRQQQQSTYAWVQPGRDLQGYVSPISQVRQPGTWFRPYSKSLSHWDDDSGVLPPSPKLHHHTLSTSGRGTWPRSTICF